MPLVRVRIYLGKQLLGGPTRPFANEVTPALRRNKHSQRLCCLHCAATSIPSGYALLPGAACTAAPQAFPAAVPPLRVYARL